ncbi:hypothetical protein GOB57_10155 [Sinorhizobium meliloti]|nr:hypothetical protein [Sinorhizobium meliloti]
MEHDVEASGGDRSVEELQDFYLNAESRAAIARDHLMEMMETQRKQAESVVGVLKSLRDTVRVSESARISLEDENRRQASRIVELERQLKLVYTNYSRLSESYSTMMRFVEDTHSNSIGLNHRIDAMLLQNDLGIARQAPQAPAQRVTEFREGVFSQPAVRHAHPENRPSETLHDGYYAPHAESEFTTYGHETHGHRPLSALRNER